MQRVKCGNLVCDWYMAKNSCIKSNTNFLLCEYPILIALTQFCSTGEMTNLFQFELNLINVVVDVWAFKFKIQEMDL